MTYFPMIRPGGLLRCVPVVPEHPVQGRVTRWLLATGSLTLHLRRAFATLTVQVLTQGRQPLDPAQAQALSRQAGTPAHARSVMLWGAGQPRVLAQSVVEQRASRGAWRAIRGLGQRPLAELLFTRSNVRRGPLRLARRAPVGPQARQVRRLWAQATGRPPSLRGLWQRWSVFTRQGQQLVVSEYFLPGEVAGWPLRGRQSAGRYRRSE